MLIHKLRLAALSLLLLAALAAARRISHSLDPGDAGSGEPWVKPAAAEARARRSEPRPRPMRRDPLRAG